MIFFSMICIIFILMLMFPIGIGLAAKKYESVPLHIQQSNIKNPRYFSLSFQNIFNKAWNEYDGSGILHMSQEEKVIEVEKIKLLPNEVCNCIVYADSLDFSPNNGICFEKEIYARGNVRLEKIPVLRAIACKQNLIIGDGTRVVRWADSDGILIVHRNCDLGISTSSATKLLIGENCSFKRLYAPIIYLGVEKADLDSYAYTFFNDIKDPIVFSEVIRDIEYVDDEITNEKGVLKNTIITKKDLTVISGFEVQGHITSHKDIKIDDNAIVHGNIFSEGNVFIGKNSKVYGIVFSQENIYLETQAVIGQPRKLKSIVARGDITFERGCRVYGYISTEGTGRICPNLL